MCSVIDFRIPQQSFGGNATFERIDTINDLVCFIGYEKAKHYFNETECECTFENFLGFGNCLCSIDIEQAMKDRGLVRGTDWKYDYEDFT